MASHAARCEIDQADGIAISVRPAEHHGMVADILSRELTMVGEIQRSLLPDVLPDIPGIDLASYYQPCARAGGDYFDVVPLVGGQWGFIMADVAGHGVAAAVIMAVMRALVHSNLPRTRALPSRAFLEFMNKQMCGVYTRDGRFVTVWCAILDPKTRLLTYASAGHPPARVLRNGDVISLDAAGGLPIGIDSDSTYDGVAFQLEQGDLLILYTDGVTDARGSICGSQAQFGVDRLDQALAESLERSASECVEQIVASVEAFTGACAPVDDQTILIAQVREPA